MAMSKRERLLAAVAGEAVDHPPCTAWIHFGSDRLGGTEHAARHARFVHDFDWDICKVVNDFRYPGPPGIETLAEVGDMRAFEPLPLTAESFAEELKCIRHLRAEFGPQMPIMITTFDPFQQVMRRVGYTRAGFVYAHRDEALRMLDAVCDTMCRYMQAVREAGCDAVFFSINSAICAPNRRGVDDETWRTFLRPYDLRMLEAMQGMVRALHVHGTDLDMQRVLDYPIEVLSVSDRLRGNPSLADLRKLSGKCLMGGIDESSLVEMSLPEVRAQVHDSIAQAGRTKLILSPGCTIPTQTPWHLLQAFRDLARTL